MIKKVFQIGVVAALMGAVNLAWAGGTELRGVRVSATPAGTQVTLDLTAATSQKLFTLDHPRRVVIDLGHTRLSGTVRLPLGAGVVSGFRIGTQPGGTVRVVMQLKSVTPARSVWMQAPGSAGRQLVGTFGQMSAATPGVGSASVAAMPVVGRVPAGAGPAGAAPVGTAASIAVDTTPRIIRAAHAPVDSGRDVVVA
ncbi:MAG TPA: AMIN domain-containing protein, partial [Steroidobacteraceae bacterium]